MIPTLIVAGVIFGRWWRITLIVSALAWPAALWATDVIGPGRQMLAAATLALPNAASGILVHQGILRGVRRLRPTDSQPRPT